MTDRTEPGPGRKQRRSRAEIEQRLIAAARQVFGQRGYSRATTRDIAGAAQVSETLLFRYFGSKANLFEQVTFTPFDQLMTEFFEAPHGAPGTDLRKADTIALLRSFLSFLKTNRQLIVSLTVKDLAEPDDARVARKLSRLSHYYHLAATELERLSPGIGHAGTSTDDKMNGDLSVRLGFGMVLASVLFSDWLFPEGEPEPEALVAGLDRLLTKALSHM